MEKQKCPEEILALATSIAIAISNNFDADDIFLLKQLLSCICSLLSLYETQKLINNKKCDKH